MLRNYLKTAIRNLLRYKGFSLINILSLVIGITGCLVIALFVYDELQYDKFITGGDNVYRLYSKRTDNNGTTNFTVVAPMYATYVKQNYPEVETTTRILMTDGKMLLETEKQRNYENKGLFVEETFLKIFPLKLLKGDANTALNEPNTVVITEDLAKRYYGTTDVIDKPLYIEKDTLAVKGVLAKLPAHFHLDINYLISFATANIAPERMELWGWQQFYTYVKLKPGTDVQQLQSKFQAAIVNDISQSSDDDGITYTPIFQPLKSIHLQSADFIFDNAVKGNLTYVKGLSLIALFVLVIACFNFINLATARSFKRAKEIGIRKVAGADRKQLVLQFLGETVLIAFISMIIATVFTMLIVPHLNNFTGKQIVFNPITNPILGLLLIGSAVVTGVLAGIYPAFVLSGFQPIKVLKGIKITGNNSGHAAWLRQGLVVIQFALSALLIVSTTIVYRQINYLHNKDLGFNKDQVLFFNVKGDVETDVETFKNELKRSPNIVSATAGYGLPGDQFAGESVSLPGSDGGKNKPVSLFIGDHDYLSTLGIQLVAGRNFSRDMKTDVDEAFIINETAVKEFGFGTPEKALGQKINWEKWIPDSLNPVKKGKVIGVVKDFHYKSLHEKVASTVIQIYPPVLFKIAVKVKTADLPNTLAFIENTWNKFAPEYPLNYKFMDESFGEMYKSEDKLSTLLWIFTVMAIVVGCMGLFGLASFSAQQRTKEISIRKVLGASIIGIVAMLSKSFLRPVVIASLIAFPVAWWAMNNWLRNFPYRVSISWWVFGIAAIAALFIALLTVSFQSIKAATSNPVKSLRTE